MTGPDLTLHTLSTASLGNRSYLVAADGWAVAVDVQRDIDRVEQIIDGHGLRLGAVLETHVHNDYVSGGLALARRHGAEYVVPHGPALGYSATRVRDADEIVSGPVRVRVLDTPGHTDAHATYAVGGADRTLAFTGGSLLFGASGRTDLLGEDRAEDLARRQYWSVRRLARLLGGDALVCPTHGFGSLCSPGLPSGHGDTVADQLEHHPAFLLNEDDFVTDLLAQCGPFPTYYRQMAPRNAGGDRHAGRFPYVPRLTGVVDLLCHEDALVLDLRPRDRWAAEHLPGSLAIDARVAVATWFGWTSPLDGPVVLVTETQTEADDAVRELHRIGVDDIRGALVTCSLPLGPDDLANTATRSFADLAEEMAAHEPLVVDVREPHEWRAGHVHGAVHLPAHRIPADPILSREAPWVYCAAGFRATIAASLLERAGVGSVVVDDDLTTAPAAGVPWCPGDSCSDELCLADLEPRRREVPPLGVEPRLDRF